MLSPEKAREQVKIIRQRVSAPVNLNFFCHSAGRCRSRARSEMAAAAGDLLPGARARSVGADQRRQPRAVRYVFCEVVEELKPEIVSFHFGLPEQRLLERVKATGAIVDVVGDDVREAVWLEQHGVDVVIAQGAEAGGHRGMFLTDNIAEQVGTFALVPQVVDAVKVPVIAAGGIADGRGIARHSRWAHPPCRSAAPICAVRSPR